MKVTRARLAEEQLTFMDLGVALSHVFTFSSGPSDALNTSSACRRWRPLASDEDVWWAKAEFEFGRGSAGGEASSLSRLAYQRKWIDAVVGDQKGSRLWKAAEGGRADVVRSMVQAGPDLDMEDDDGWTPLLIAAQNDHLDVVRCLVEAGADKDKATTDDGSTPLDIACWYGHRDVEQCLSKVGVQGRR